MFQRIQDGIYDFPQNEWDEISEEAKDLIRHLLVRDPNMRYSAADVLSHPWIVQKGHKFNKAPLATPRILMRYATPPTNSVLNLTRTFYFRI